MFLAISPYINLAWGFIGTYATSLAVDFIGISYLILFIREPEKNQENDKRLNVEIEDKGGDATAASVKSRNIFIRFFIQFGGKAYLLTYTCDA